MKLDSKLAFCHSNIGLEPDCQSFEFSDSDLEHAGHKSGNWKVKKVESKTAIDLKRNDIESLKESANAEISDSPKEIESFENSSDVFTDKSVTEYEPEFNVCYKENDYHMIKDICVDEGVPAKDKILFENSVDKEVVYKFLPSESFGNAGLMIDNVGISVPFPATEESDEVSANPCGSKVPIQRGEDAVDNPIDNVHKETVSPGDKVLLQDLFDREKSTPSIDKGDYEIEHNHEQVCGEPEELKNKIEEAVLASRPLAHAVNGSNTDGTPENGSMAHEFDPSAFVACSKEDSESQNLPDTANGKCDDQTATTEFRRSLGESSFSAVGPVSSQMNYSEPVPYSGSISLRSDSSTTSTRSFAFPIIQSEWKGSPVRMAKAERRHYRKHGGWRGSLLCCRF